MLIFTSIKKVDNLFIGLIISENGHFFGCQEFEFEKDAIHFIKEESKKRLNLINIEYTIKNMPHDSQELINAIDKKRKTEKSINIFSFLKFNFLKHYIIILKKIKRLIN